ncbi:ectoine/hydroxyectoine ABC transporter substrate-binding protein EhuB [Candidatus Oscillochloris fontis]|uniref:ectoine/hydroxyectoine ABC transporter substrate-binding protein EhuB n=1 Tax=Candidatus Oscillochloris fontis TaxID=2496868 RepID=UPI00101CCBC5|nr:ectoine/hydroxyectoine ABC transporter substrate-binding protein EhuB [Candidatus Oscillochloris fontis]
MITHQQRRNRITFWLGLALLAILVGLFVARDRSFENIQRADRIRIGYAVEAPFAFTRENRRVTGESPEVARAVVERMGISQITWIQTEFDQLIPDLRNGRFDVIAAGMFITPERARWVAFSEPTFHVQQGLLVRIGNPHNLHTYEQVVQTAGIRVAVLDSSIEQRMLQQIGLAPERLIRAPDIPTARVAVESDLADAFAISAPTLRWLVKYEYVPQLEVATPFVQPDPAHTDGLGYGGFAFRQEDRALRTAWNRAMDTLINSRDHLQIIAPFGFTEAELPGAITTQEVLTQ